MTFRRGLGLAGKTLIGAGILILLFVAYQLWGTQISESRSQDSLRHQLDRQLAAAREAQRHDGTPSASGSDATPTTFEPGRPVTAVAAPAAGGPVGTIQIPRIGVDKVVVEGTQTADLRKGPGHYPGTPLPGEAGNVAIAGHRTTYGAPFYNLNELSSGDPILITTVQGTFRYNVARQVVVAPNDVAVAGPTPSNQLTLTTCNPRFSAAQRLVVQANLVGAPVPAPVRPPARASSDRSLAGSEGNWVPALWYGLLAAAALAAIWLLARQARSRRNRAIVYLGATPVVLVVLFLFFENVSPLLPASF